MATTTKPRRAAIYTRVSLDKTGEQLAVKRQHDLCTERALREGWTVAYTFEDNSKSASTYSRDSRDSYRELVEAIERGEVDGVVTYSVDRLYRSLDGMQEFLALVQAHEVPVLTVRDSELDLSSPSSIAMARVAAVFAQMEVDVKSERQKAANLQRASMGKHYRRKIPFGYAAGPSGLVLDEVKGPALREAFEAVLAGKSALDVLHTWEREGIPTYSGKPWQTATVRSILRNPVYAGVLMRNGVEISTEEIDWEPIITREEHELVKGALAARAIVTKRTHSGAGRRSYLLTGILRCACGAVMTGGKSRHVRYLCQARDRGECYRSMLVSKADALVESYAVGVLTNIHPESVLDAEAVKTQAKLAEKLGELADERSELLANHQLARRDRVALLAELEEEYQGALRKVGELTSQNTIARLVARVLRWDTTRPTLEDMGRTRETAREALETLEFDQKRALINAIGVYQVTGERASSTVRIFPRDPITGEVSPYSVDEDPHATED